jgi:poly-gamma-glutamate capsule biosynthesis protein CapA/YwtB (metallophosphatase superfamily)
MLSFLQTILSRRRFVKSGAALPLVLIVACRSEDEQRDDATVTPEPTPTPEGEVAIATATPEPTATPESTPTATPTPTPTPESTETVRYSVAEGLNVEDHALLQGILEHLESVVQESGQIFERAEDGDEVDILIGPATDSSDEAIRIPGEPIIAVVRVDNLVNEIQQDDLQPLTSGSLANWQELGGQDWIVHPVRSRSLATSIGPNELEAHRDDELSSIASDHPGLIALVPRSHATFHLQALIVDEIDPLRDELTLENWPWWDAIDVQLSADDDLDERLRAALGQFAGEQRAERRTMVSVVGDVMLGRTPHRIMTERNDWRAPFPLVADELQKGDLTIGNLECAITDSFSPPEDPRTFSFMTFTDAVEGLEFAGFHALSGANNHALDFGVVGMRDTTAALAAVGIQHFGTGDNLDEAREPCLLEHNGVTFGFLGYDAISMQYAGATAESGGVAPLVREYVVEDIQRTREQADVVIPYFHWGIEYTLTPTENDRRMAHAAVEAGADLVLGGHPHWIQGMEIYQGVPIFYSTSNFVFDQEWSFETKQGFVLHLIWEGTRLAGYRVVPVLIEDFHRPRIVEDDVRTAILGRFWESTSIIASTPLE